MAKMSVTFMSMSKCMYCKVYINMHAVHLKIYSNESRAGFQPTQEVKSNKSIKCMTKQIVCKAAPPASE